MPATAAYYHWRRGKIDGGQTGTIADIALEAPKTSRDTARSDVSSGGYSPAKCRQDPESGRGGIREKGLQRRQHGRDRAPGECAEAQSPLLLSDQAGALRKCARPHS